MTRQWVPGDVAMIHGVVAMRFEYSHLTCPTLHKFDGDHWHRADGVWIVSGADDDARPLVVIDAADDVWLPNRLRIDAGELGGQTAISMRRIADEIEEQQRPPKSAEPTGLGAVVVDIGGTHWIRARPVGNAVAWRSWPGGMWHEWSDLDIEAEPLSQGVEQLADWKIDLLRGAR